MHVSRIISHMAISEVPEPWASAMDKVGAVSPQTNLPSINALSDKSGVHATTISNIIKGITRVPDAQTLSRLAEALRERPKVVAGWVGIDWGAPKPWELPSEAALLDATEREAVEKIIRLLAKQKVDSARDGIPSVAAPLRKTPRKAAAKKAVASPRKQGAR